jgi:hypothetical protein
VTTPLKRFLVELATNADRLAAFQSKPDDAMYNAGLSPEDIAAIKSRNAAWLEARLDVPSERPVAQPAGVPVTIVIVPGCPQGYWPQMPCAMPVQGGVAAGAYPAVYMMCPPGYAPQGGGPPVTYAPFAPHGNVTYVTTLPGAMPPGPFAAHGGGPIVTYVVKNPEPYPEPRQSTRVTYLQPAAPK